jgi:hypothetical protein
MHEVVYQFFQAENAWKGSSARGWKHEMEMNMHKIVFGVLAVAAILVATRRNVEARYDYPWCAQFADDGGAFNCAFVSFDQCLATVSGVGGFCMRNPARALALPTFDSHRGLAPRHSARHSTIAPFRARHGHGSFAPTRTTAGSESVHSTLS